MLRRRVLTAVIALSVLSVVLFALPALPARGIIALLMLGGAWEWGRFVFGESRPYRLAYVLLIAVMIGGLAAVLPDADIFHLVLQISLGWWIVALLSMFFFPMHIGRPVTFVCGALVIVPAWLALDSLYLMSPKLLLFALLIVWMADIGAFFVGKGFGKVKLAPRISPGKTWEGVLGGLCAVVVLAAAGSAVLDIDVAVLVPFCVAVAMLSIVGDLTVSMFKRTAGVKDSGTLFPGHGGILDRIDSVAAAAPLFAFGLHWTGLS